MAGAMGGRPLPLREVAPRAGGGVAPRAGGGLRGLVFGRACGVRTNAAAWTAGVLRSALRRAAAVSPYE
ncbi:hypothetical protein GCM10009416_11150 [Craurococcus roseus]|uniref:Uncharacterized protein n=1 Tax=Craurococcus roseus TaxID=77585 RepID=A0ABN1EUU9_9PROT